MSNIEKEAVIISDRNNEYIGLLTGNITFLRFAELDGYTSWYKQVPGLSPKEKPL